MTNWKRMSWRRAAVAMSNGEEQSEDAEFDLTGIEFQSEEG